MADTVLKYLKNSKEETLTDRPFCEVDSLILCQFSYLKFDGLVPGVGNRDAAVTLKEIHDDPRHDSLFADERYRKNNEALFELMCDSRRFSGMKIHSYTSYIEHELETQFAAIVCEFEDGTTYVAFRGTDENLVGWKEDLNLALSVPVPGQIMSVKYLDEVAPYLQGDFIVGGHSKGGNLSVFSAMYCSKGVRDRISLIYNHDGPGLRNEIMDDERYSSIRDRIRMSVPHSSLIGMLLVNYDNYKVVDCKSIGIMQHDPFNWKLQGNEFKLMDSVKESVALRDRSINQWVMSLEQDQIKLFVDTVYELMLATGADNLNQLRSDLPQVVPRLVDAINKMDDETKDMMFKIVDVLIKYAEENAKEELTDHVEEFKDYAKNVWESAEKVVQNIPEIPVIKQLGQNVQNHRK